MVTALASLLSGRPVRSDVAMTGEVTLTGQVLPIGGLKEKALAAQRNGIQWVIAPALNEPDIDEIPATWQGRSNLCSCRDRRGAGGGARVGGGPRGIAYPDHSTHPTPEGAQWHSTKESAKAVPFNAADLANITKANPYVQRLIEDAKLRDNVRTALDSSKSAYERLSNGKAPAEGAARGQEAPERRPGGRRGRPRRGHGLPRPQGPQRPQGPATGPQAADLVVGAVAALAASESLRSKVLDTLFGAEEEFQYTPPARHADAAAGEPGDRRLTGRTVREGARPGRCRR